MKEIINYYYNLDCLEIEENKNYASFNYYGDNFYFVFFNRTKEELDDLINISQELIQKGIKVHTFVLNRFNSYITKVGDNNYVLLKINCNKDEVVNFWDLTHNLKLFKLNTKNSKLYRNNWGELWSKKIDYFEYQIKELGKDKQIVLNSFSYYVGMAENAISYVNKINKVLGESEFDNIVLSHRRIFFPNTHLNYLNPLSFIFDLEVRDIAESLKVGFFHNEDSLLDLRTYLKTNKLSKYSYHMLYARLLYPSYYFDIYESIMNNNEIEEKLLPIIKKVNDYERFLKLAYEEISIYTNLERIIWILKKEL